LPGDNLDLIPHELMSKYIAYARQVSPLFQKVTLKFSI
jgi:hypothetical protein